MAYNRTRTMNTSLLGPTKEELEEFLSGLPQGTRIRVDKDPGYNQLDPGSLTFTASEGSTRTVADTGVTEWRNR